MIYERAHLERLLTVLDATPRALRRDGCGDWAIKGKRGYIYADGSGFLIVVSEGDFNRFWTNIKRKRFWANTKRKLAFCRVRQDGDDEGSLHLDHLPTPAEADLIRDTVKIKRKRHHTPDQLATITARLRKNATRHPSRPARIRQKRKQAAGVPRTDYHENFPLKRASTGKHRKKRPLSPRTHRQRSKGKTA